MTTRCLRLPKHLCWLCIGLLSLLSAMVPHHLPPSLTLGAALASNPPTVATTATQPAGYFASANADIEATFEQGRQAYDRQDYEGAIALWQSLLPHANPLEQAALLNNISLAQQALHAWEAAEQTIHQSLTLLGWQPTDPPATPSHPDLLASALDVYGQWLYHQGQTDTALNTWQQAHTYHRQSNSAGIAIARNWLNQAQALQYLGRHLDAQALLRDLYGWLHSPTTTLPTDIQIDILLNLGQNLRMGGNLAPSEPSSTDSLNALQVLRQAESWGLETHPDRLSNIYIELGNTYREIAQRYQTLGHEKKLRDNVDAANHAYQQALEQSRSPREISIARLNQLSFEVEQTRWSLSVLNHDVTALVQTLQQDLANLPTDGATLEARTKFTATLVNLNRSHVNLGMTPRELLQFSGETVSQANKLGNVRLLSLAWGTLGAVYEQFANNQLANLDDAFQATEQALAFSMQMGAPEINYRWFWQTGRILHQQGHVDAAIVAYDAAVREITVARKALIPINSEVQFSFRDDVEPVYRQYIDLLTLQATVENLNKSIEVIDALQLAELENFLGCDLSDSVRVDQNLDEIDPDAVFVYPILLKNRLEMIVKIPGQSVNHFSTPVSRIDVERRLQKISTDIRNGHQQRADLEAVYTWLIAPLEETLAAAEVSPKTLIMPLDSYFRNIPIAALIDPETGEYVVEKPYALAILPTVQLFNLAPFTAQEQQYLLAGIEEALTVPGRRPFAALDLEREMTAISQVPKLTQLLNQEVTRDNLARSEDAQVIHLITHGNFSSDPEETYLLAYGQEPGIGDLIKAREINQVLRLDGSNPERQLNLLFLAACHTASGDNRAVLGLAGLTVQARAAAAIASLWKVDDKHVGKLAEIFYQELMKPEVTKAEALHQAQQQMVRDRQHQNPSAWAPFVVVGNWR
jgi:CHAT domain-containing protein